MYASYASLVDKNERGRRLANEPNVERVYVADEAAMLAALRVVLGLPKRTPFGQEA